MKARELAFAALLKMDRAGSYSNLTLDAVLEGEKPSEADRRLASQLFYGVLERKLTLDYALSRYMKQKPESWTRKCRSPWNWALTSFFTCPVSPNRRRSTKASTW